MLMQELSDFRRFVYLPSVCLSICLSIQAVVCVY